MWSIKPVVVNKKTVEEDYKKISKYLEHYGMKDKIVCPNLRYMISVHGAMNSGKSSFINKLVGFPVETVYENEQDTFVSIVFTLPENEFHDLNAKKAQPAELQAIEKLTFEQLMTEMSSEVVDDVKSENGAVMVIKDIGTLHIAKCFGLHNLAGGNAGSSPVIPEKKLRVMVVNERVYEHFPQLFPSIGTDAQQKEYRNKRIAMAKRMVMIDTPGLKKNDCEVDEIESILKQADRSFFLHQKNDSDPTSFKTFATAVKKLHFVDKKQTCDASVWNKINFLQTKSDCAGKSRTIYSITSSVCCEVGLNCPIDSCMHEVCLQPSSNINAGGYPNNIEGVIHTISSNVANSMSDQYNMAESILKMGRVLAPVLKTKSFCWGFFGEDSSVRADLDKFEARYIEYTTRMRPEAAASPSSMERVGGAAKSTIPSTDQRAVPEVTTGNSIESKKND